ncbi:MAG TPA: TetR family transcriptional regulator C-terminal domain-containing protein [Actinoallomurus sp.]|nr:TetR family transcriptional regulator C-terminal domain-containing protein [Actinoallomurus sp.]
MLTTRLAGLRSGGALRVDADPAALAVVLTALIDGLLLHLMADPGLDIRSPAASLVAPLRPDQATETRGP